MDLGHLLQLWATDDGEMGNQVKASDQPSLPQGLQKPEARDVGAGAWQGMMDPLMGGLDAPGLTPQGKALEGMTSGLRLATPPCSGPLSQA